MSDHPRVAERAKRIVRNETDAWEKSVMIMEWVYQKLDYAPDANATNALQILDSLEGDCSEHALLAVALSRAVGVPARQVTGFVYAGEGILSFAGHAWVEVHDGHRWRAMDPTWHQTEIDATHIKFTDNSSDFSWFNALGKIELEVLEFERADE